MTRAMVLPVADAAGEVNAGHLWSGDDRVPGRLTDRWGETCETRSVASHVRSAQCPDGRHLWDVIESAAEHELEVETPEGFEVRYECDFRARLTCVRCGIVRAWEGRRTEDRHVSTLAPAPLSVGDLLAQMVRAGSYDWDRYVIHRAEDLVVVGELSPGRGLRGRRFVAGRLHTWPQGVAVEGKTAIAALRAVVRHDRALAARESA